MTKTAKIFAIVSPILLMAGLAAWYFFYRKKETADVADNSGAAPNASTFIGGNTKPDSNSQPAVETGTNTSSNTGGTNTVVTKPKPVPEPKPEPDPEPTEAELMAQTIKNEKQNYRLPAPWRSYVRDGARRWTNWENDSTPKSWVRSMTYGSTDENWPSRFGNQQLIAYDIALKLFIMSQKVGEDLFILAGLHKMFEGLRPPDNGENFFNYTGRKPDFSDLKAKAKEKLMALDKFNLSKQDVDNLVNGSLFAQRDIKTTIGFPKLREYAREYHKRMTNGNFIFAN